MSSKISLHSVMETLSTSKSNLADCLMVRLSWLMRFPLTLAESWIRKQEKVLIKTDFARIWEMLRKLTQKWQREFQKLSNSYHKLKGTSNCSLNNCWCYLYFIYIMYHLLKMVHFVFIFLEIYCNSLYKTTCFFTKNMLIYIWAVSKKLSKPWVIFYIRSC